MMTKFVAAALIGSTLTLAPALAQTSADAQRQINASSTGQWQASQLLGLDVYDNRNEKIGDVKELMMDKSGKIDKAVLGVGGFLGLGEHDVAVNFSELKFSDQPAPSTTATSGSGSPNATGMASNTKKNYPDHAVLDITKDQLQSMPRFNYSR